MANAPFDPSSPPSDGALVPADCVWAYVSHPGDFPDYPYGKTVPDSFRRMGTLRGRTFDEIAEVVGLPQSAVNLATGGRVATWTRTTLFGGYEITLSFDPYAVCVAVVSEGAK